jgi:hypothetical protein
VKATRKREREHGPREYREELLPMSWAPPSLRVVGIMNLSGKLGASRSSLATKEQLVGDGDSKLSRLDGADLRRSCEV